MEEKYLSVITNFGCHYKCPECIVRNNGLKIPKTYLGSCHTLSNEIVKNRVNWVSFSGGGDPLFISKDNYATWRAVWYLLFKDCKDNNVKTELHTSFKSYIDFYSLCSKYNNQPAVNFLRKFDRIVYHCHSVWELDELKRYRPDQIIRVVFVVGPTFTKEEIDAIADSVALCDNIDELSFRQYVDEKYEIQYYLHDYLKEGHKKCWWYIEQDDYNLYFCENKVYTKYNDIGKDDE